MNLLVMPVWKAQQILRLWNDNPWLTLTMIVCLLIAISCLYFGVVTIISVVMKMGKAKVLWYSATMLIIGIGLGIPLASDDVGVNVGAAHNVIDYHKIRHLKRIYPTLPHEPYTYSKVYNSNSIAKAAENKRKSEYTSKYKLTRNKAVAEYNDIKAKHRSITRKWTKSLRPHAPRWYDYL